MKRPAPYRFFWIRTWAPGELMQWLQERDGGYAVTNYDRPSGPEKEKVFMPTEHVVTFKLMFSEHVIGAA